MFSRLISSSQIDENLERADIILLLVSDAFIHSKFCYEREMPRALERERNSEARVIPIIVRDVDWHEAEFARLNVLPTNGKAVTDTSHWPNRDSAWRDVSEGIKKIVKETSKKPRR